MVQDAIPAGTTYVGGTAAAGNTLPTGVASYQVFYSVDGGNSWTNAQPSPASAVTHLRWWLSDPLQAGAGGTVAFGVSINNPYTRTSPIIPNTAGLSFGNTPPFMTDDAETRVLGGCSVGDTVYADTGVGTGGYLANGIEDGTEPGIANITVWLYSDSNTGGVVDTGERLVATTNTASNGTYLFNQLADGRYVVVVDAEDPQMPAGYTSHDRRAGRRRPGQRPRGRQPGPACSPPISASRQPSCSPSGSKAAPPLRRRARHFHHHGHQQHARRRHGRGQAGKIPALGQERNDRHRQQGVDQSGNAYQSAEPNGQYAVAPMLAADEWMELSS